METEGNNLEIQEEEKMSNYKKTSKQKRKKTSGTHYKIELRDKIYVSDLLAEDKRRIYSAFNQKKYLPFYKSSGTSVFTSRKPADFEDLYIKPTEFKNYMPKAKDFRLKQKKPVRKKKKGKG